MRFTKMQGCGNDYVYVNGFEETVADPAALAVAVSRPHFGVGSDGLILILPSERADFRMRMFNSDGSEGAMCGNGARCVGRYVFERGLTDRTRFTLETGGGVREVEVRLGTDGAVRSVRVDMGVAQGYRQEDGVAFVSFGNGHRVEFVGEDPFEWKDFARVAEPICLESGLNVEYVRVLGDGRVRMRVWERGSGETLACGSGACASALAALRMGHCRGPVTVEMRGGEVTVEVRADGRVLMDGPAAFVFDGVWAG